MGAKKKLYPNISNNKESQNFDNESNAWESDVENSEFRTNHENRKQNKTLDLMEDITS